MSKQKAETIRVRLVAIRYEAKKVRSYEFSPLSTVRLPAFSAGAHIDLHLPIGLVRQYSLIGGSSGGDYKIAAALDANSQGGSKWMFSHLHVGAELEISLPRNNFSLVEAEGHSVLFAGGIGITPIYQMVKALESAGKDWVLYYAAKSEREAAFVVELREFGERCHFHFDDEHAEFLDMSKIVASADKAAHFYFCGPSAMMKGFASAVSDLPADFSHSEVFQAEPVLLGSGDEGAFEVELVRSGQTLYVGADETILEAVEAAGVSVSSSCKTGVCGSCETRVLSGDPDHRDLILSEAEKVAGETMMICCSRAKSTKLRLDI